MFLAGLPTHMAEVPRSLALGAGMVLASSKLLGNRAAKIFLGENSGAVSQCTGGFTNVWE